jgi:hypothetical protein
MNILVIHTGSNVDIDKTLQIIKKKFAYPESNISLLVPDRLINLYEANPNIDERIPFDGSEIKLNSLLTLRRDLKRKRFDMAFIPQQEGDRKKLDSLQGMILMLMGIFLYFCKIKEILFFYNNFKLCNFNLKTLINDFTFRFFRLLIAPFIIMLRLPYFFIKVVIGNFILPREDKNDEFIGFGPYRRLSGHVFFLGKAKMVKKYGLFGIAHDDYMGIPVTLHRSPLDALLLRYAGYRKFVGLTVLLLAIAFIWIIIHTGNIFLLALLPLIFLSSYFIKSIFVGHLEFLPWAFLSLSIVSFVLGQIEISALFFSLTILSHISIALIGGFCIMTIVGYNIFYGYPIMSTILNLLIFGMIVGATTSFFIVPFIKTRHKLSRDELITKNRGWKSVWDFRTLTQAIVYSIFVCSIFLLIPVSELHFMVLLPLLALYINTKIRWLFSAYTIELAMLIIGTIFIIFNPNLISILCFLYLIYTSPAILLSGYYGVTPYQITLKPITLGSLRGEIKGLFLEVPKGGRVALEAGPLDKRGLFYLYNAHLSYLLVEEDVELLNGHAPEWAEVNIYLDIVRYIDSQTSERKLKEVLKKGGAKYILVYSSEFKGNLRKYSYKEIGSVDCRELKQIDTPGPAITLFEAPFNTSIIEPETEIFIKPNYIQFRAKKYTTYLLKYNYYPGWRAFQDGKRIKIEDAHPGMIIKAPQDGEIVLKYRYRHYWM